MVYPDLSDRAIEAWLVTTDTVCEAFELPRIPDHTTLQRTYQRLRNLDFETMQNRILEEEHM